MGKRSAEQMAAAAERIAKRVAKANRFVQPSSMRMKKFTKTGTKFFDKDGQTPELKYADGLPSGIVGVGGIANVIPLNAIAEGLDSTQNRIGRKIQMKSISVKLLVGNSLTNLNSGLAAYGGDKYRVSLVYDKQTNGATPTYGDIYNNATSPNAVRNINTVDRFDVLWNEEFVLCSGGPNCVSIDKYVKVGLPTRFQGTGSGISNINMGAVYLCLASDYPGSVNNATFDGVSRIAFVDN